MAIDCYLDGNLTSADFSIEDAGVSAILPALNQLREKTGIWVDPYGDSRISPEHARTLINLLKDNQKEAAKEFSAFLRKAVNKNSIVRVIGE